MAFNVVRVLEIEPGAELDGTVYDQWVKIGYKEYSLSLFDMNMLAYEKAAGDYHEISIGVMFTELEEEEGPMMANRNMFRGRVVAVAKENGFFEHVVDLDGLKVILSDHEEHKIGASLRFKARLDLLDFRGAVGGWKNI